MMLCIESVGSGDAAAPVTVGFIPAGCVYDQLPDRNSATETLPSPANPFVLFVVIREE